MKRGAEHLDCTLVQLATLWELRPVVPEGCVDHAVGLGCSGAQAFQIFEVAAVHLCADSGKGFGARIAARKPMRFTLSVLPGRVKLPLKLLPVASHSSLILG